MEKKYIGKGKVKIFDNGGSVINCFVKKDDCEFNEKGYMNFSISVMKEADKYGNTHTIYLTPYKPKEEPKEPEYLPPAEDGLPF